MRKSYLLIHGIVFGLIIAVAHSCNTKQPENKMEKSMEQELTKIDSLLRDKNFTYSMAETLDAAYYIGIGESVPPFISPADDTSFEVSSLKDEKIATNLAGFYALEAGINYLVDKTKQSPSMCLQQIVEDKLDSTTHLLLNRFANATWKAGQPFRGMDRITRPTFIIASRLPVEEVKKDADQIHHAAKKLQTTLQHSKATSTEKQMQELRSLLQSESYALEMAAWLDSSYYANQSQPSPSFLTKEEETATKKKSATEIKIATNCAGFYAMECGLNYFVSTRQVLPSTLLKSLIDNTMPGEDKMIFARFANATWKAGQPFRGISRITRDIFVPFYFLKQTDIEKDMVQVRAAAEKLLKAL